MAAAVVRMKPVENREKEIDVSSFVQTEDFTYQGLPWNLSKEEAEESLVKLLILSQRIRNWAELFIGQQKK